MFIVFHQNESDRNSQLRIQLSLDSNCFPKVLQNSGEIAINSICLVCFLSHTANLETNLVQSALNNFSRINGVTIGTSGNEWNNLIFCVANNTTSCTSSGTAIHNTVNSKLQSTGTIESGTGLWHASSWYVANNSSGFTALPLPKRYSGAGPGGFQQTAWGYYASFWTSTIDPNFPLYLSQEINMGTSSQSVCVGGTSKSEGNSIRCIKD